MVKRILQVLLGAVLLVLVTKGSYLAWRLRAPRTLSIVVVDKTVPFRKYREHAFVPWLLRATKTVTPDGRFLDESRDYVGFDPVQKVGHDLEPAHLAEADVLFVADTYGVYVGDYRRPGDIAALERSPRIYGGMTEAEADALEAFSARGGLVIGEFNTFASPTADGARDKLQRSFGVRWTRWVGRYWPDMEDLDEVPRWVGHLYKRVYKRPLEVRGAAFVFVRGDEDIVVLEVGRHLEPEMVTMERTNEAPELTGLPPTSSYWYWLDVVERVEADVLYEHVLRLTSSGAAVVKAHDLPARFPALTRRTGRSTFYFAGDFVDNAAERGDPERAGLLWWRRAMLGSSSSSDERFLWGWYAPILERLLESKARSR